MLEGEGRDGTVQAGVGTWLRGSSTSSSTFSSSSAALTRKTPESLDIDSPEEDAEETRMGEGGPLMDLGGGEASEGKEEEEEELDEAPVVSDSVGGKEPDSSVEGVIGTEGVGVEVGAGRAFDRGGGASGLMDARGEVGVEREEGESDCVWSGGEVGREESVSVGRS